jgi:hypothetical protein
MENEDLIKHQKEISKKRRTFSQARAIIQRGRNAGIPKPYIRMPQGDFENLLCPKFHNAEKFAELVYKKPQVLFEKPFIVIDGGTPSSRKKAGYAVLFRMIACDKNGLSEGCGQLASKFQTFTSGGENRNELVTKMQQEQILLLHEFRPKDFSIHLADSGNLFDQLLGFREDYSKPTIITFTYPLENGVINMGNAVKDDRCGSYLATLSHADSRKDQNVFRIKVK